MTRTFWILLLAASVAIANKVDPPVAMTGAPGEQTCASCHAGTGGVVAMDFSSLTYVPGVTQTIRVTVRSGIFTGMQITARLASNELQQAGHFTAGEFTRLRTVNGLEYVSQNVVTGTTVFTIDWTPPATNVGNVRFYVAAVVGNDGRTPEPYTSTATYTMAPGTKRALPSGFQWQNVPIQGVVNPAIRAYSSDGRWTGTHGSGAFVRDAAGNVTLFTSPGTTSSITPTAINNAGRVVGYYDDGGFVREANGSITRFVTSQTGFTRLTSITDGGLITGYDGIGAFQSTAPPAFFYTDNPGLSPYDTIGSLNNGTTLQTTFGLIVLRNGQDTAVLTASDRVAFAMNDNADYITIPGLVFGTQGIYAQKRTAPAVAGFSEIRLDNVSLPAAVSPTGEIALLWNGIGSRLIPCEATTSVTSRQAPAAGGSVTVPVTTTTPGCVANAIGKGWISTQNNGVPGDVTLRASANYTGATRTTTVLVAGTEVTVTQDAAPCPVSVAQAAGFGGNGGTGSLEVNPEFSCPWTATSNVAWITLTGLTGSTARATVPYAVAPNDGPTLRTGTITVGDKTFTVTQSAAPACSYTVTPGSLTAPAAGGTQSFAVTAGPTCAWTATSPAPWITPANAAGTGSGSVPFVVSANTTGAARAATLTIAGQSITVVQPAGGTVSGLRFVSLTPCRLLETRTVYAPAYQTGVYGPPYLTAGSTRTIPVNGFTGCPIPTNAKAMVFNVTLVPRNGIADFVTIYPTGEAQPDFWTIRSPDGQTVANTAIVKLGANNSINVYTSHDTDLLIDAFAYFTDDSTAANLAYYPVTPCRVVETRAEYRSPAGPFGPPTMAKGETRRFKFPGNGYCNVPAGAAAYSVTLTAVPPASLAYITAWAAGVTQPVVSNMNSFAGRTLANNILVPVSSDGSMDVYTYDYTDILIDINGYFAPDNGSGLFYYPVTQCRASDTRSSAYPSPFGTPAMGSGETRSLAIPSSTTRCSGIPANAKAFVVNATSISSGVPMPFLTMWDTGGAQPNASQLNAFQGQTVTNLAIVPAGTNGSINVYTYRPTQLVLDVSGYFGR